MKVLIGTLAVVIALAVGIGTAAAAGGADVQTRTVEFVLSSDACDNLPDGTTVTGTGTERSITNVRTDQNGVMTISNTTHTHGTAIDGDGNTYVFNYSNEFRVTNTTGDQATFNGTMNDSFSLVGSAGRLSNGFLANVTFEFDSTGAIIAASFDPLHSRGNPIDFATGLAQCDPL
jgi:hypothetical protein